VIRHQPGAQALAQWSRGRLDLNLNALDRLPPADKAYGLLLGQALFRDDIRDAFVRAMSGAQGGDERLRVLLIVEADDLRDLHWEQLCAPLDRGWDYLLLNQQTPFSLYLPSQIERRFPPIGRRDLRALILVAGPEEVDGDYGLASFDVAATVNSLRRALGQIPCDVLARVEGANGPPRLDTLCKQIAARADAEAYTLLHLVCHGTYHQGTGETLLYFPEDEGLRPVQASTLIERLGRLRRLPHLTFLSTCESADPRAEAGLGGLGQRLVRELGTPAVVAMTDRISVNTAEALASAFFARLRESGEVDCALSAALVGLQGRYDVTVPALFGRLGGRPLFSDALDRPLTETEIGFGLEQMRALIEQRAPVLLPEVERQAATVQSTLGADPAALSAEARRERQAALAAANQLCSQALDLSFNALALGQAPPTYDGRCPFPGLLAFGARYVASGQKEQDDRAFFFGREALVDKLMGRLMAHGFLAVLGPSGCGKSSLVLAGLVPTLQERWPRLRAAYLQPGSEPLAQLEAALSGASSGDGRPNLIVVDQFEELFTLCRDEGKRQVFVDRLLTLSANAALVLTLRADFWGECAAYRALKDEMQAHQELVGPMDAAALRRAMERQADQVGLRFEAGLGEAILDDVEGEPGAMPLLQHALLLLWQRRHGRWLRWEEYRAIGGIQQAIAHTADEVYLGLAGQEQERMRDIFLRLTRLEDAPAGAEARDTRRRVGLAELVPAGSEPAETVTLVKRLADARLLVTSLNTASGQEEVEVAHEALIRHWPRLRDWLEEDRAELHLREGVREAAREWEASDRDEAYLVHRGGRLEDVEALRQQPRFALNELEQAYVEACVELRERERREKEEQQRRELEAARTLAAEQQLRAEEQAASASRMRRRAIVIGAVGIVALVLAALSVASTWDSIISNREYNEKASEASAKEHSHLMLAVEMAKVKLDEEPDLALLLGIQAYRTWPRLELRQALFQMLNHTSELSRFLHGHDAQVTSVAWSADGRQLASGSSDGTVIVWDLETDLPAHTLEGHTGEVTSVTWSADGQRLASGSSDETVIAWDLESEKPVEPRLEGHQSGVSSVAWSEDGQWLASGSADGTVIVWDLETGQPVEPRLEGHQSGVSSVAWSWDGRQLASGSQDGTVIVWDLETGQPDRRLKEHQSNVTSVAWSEGGLQLASGSQDGTVIVWDLETSQPAPVTLEGHTGEVTSVVRGGTFWTPWVAAGSSDETVIAWDLESEKPAHTLEGHIGAVTSVAWSADGRWLASGSEDNTVQVWPMDTIAEACQRAGRNLSRAEWASYFAGEEYQKTCEEWPEGE
jgi:WD40 repeat protein